MQNEKSARHKKRLLMLVSAIENEEDESSGEDEVCLLQSQVLPVISDKGNLNSSTLGCMKLVRSRRTCIRDYVNRIVPLYTDEEFRMHFRINRNLFHSLTQRFEEDKIYENLRSEKKCPASKHLLVFLWFAGHEACSFRDIADRFDITISSVHRIIKRVTGFFSSLSSEVIRWPTPERKQQISSYFEEKTQFPRVIGIIDGTHIIIDPPRNGKDEYIDRKGQTSICLQGICDERKKFIDIFVGFPGSVHDSRVFNNSFICPKLEKLCADNFILGDSAYPVLENLLTPFRDNGHLTAAQKHYNKKLSSCRVYIEHAFGILKQRFRQLYYCKLRDMKTLCHFVRAVCVLHNIANETDLDLTEVDVSIESAEDTAQEDEIITTTGKAIRDYICQQMWEKQHS